MILLEGRVLSKSYNYIRFDQLDHPIVELVRDLCVPLIAFYFDLAVVLATTHAVALRMVVRSEVSDCILGESYKLLEAHSFRKLGEGLHVVVEIAVTQL